MSLPIHCSSILFNEPFGTVNDFTVSFTYTMDTSGTDPQFNQGFSVFFVDGNVTTLSGGGAGPGLGVVSTGGSPGRPQPVSSPQGLFTILGFDIAGNFSHVNSIRPFTTGNAIVVPNSIGLRISPNYSFVGSQYVYPINPYLYGPLGPTQSPEAYQTVRVSVRKNFTEILVHSLDNETYTLLATFNFYISSLPETAKFGISYSGDTLFEVQNITVNSTWLCSVIYIINNIISIWL